MSTPSFQIHALPTAAFDALSALDAATRVQRNIVSVIADNDGGYPCRVSLVDAAVGEPLWLLSYEYHAVEGPYRSSGPIFVRQAALQAQPPANEVPALLQRRLLSARVYGHAQTLRHAEVLPGEALAAWLHAQFEKPETAYIHLHNARYGCYLCCAHRA